MTLYTAKSPGFCRAMIPQRYALLAGKSVLFATAVDTINTINTLAAAQAASYKP